MDSTELENVMKEIVPFLDATNKAMSETLEVVLQYTASAEHRNAFRNTNVIERLLDLALNEHEKPIGEKTLTSVFSALINFTIDPPYIEQCVNKKASQRTFHFLMSSLKPQHAELELQKA